MKMLLASRPFSPLSQVPTKRTNPFVEDIAEVLRPLPLAAAARSPFIKYPSSSTGRICRPKSVTEPGSASPGNSGRKAALRTQKSGSAETATRIDLRRKASYRCTDLNATPSKCVGDRTPAEVFRADVTVEGYRTEKLSYRQKSQKS